MAERPKGDDMTDYLKVIFRYEKARRLVRDLSAKKRALVDSCLQEGITEENRPFKQICLHDAFDSWAEGYDYDGGHRISFLEYCKIALEEGEICSNCYEIVRIKRTDLMDAKKEFAAAKRAMNNAGKKIIQSGFYD